MVRIAIANVKSTGATGVMILMNHITYDSISFGAFRQVLELLLEGKAVTEPRVPYKIFKDMHYQHSTSLNAQARDSFPRHQTSGNRLLT